MAESDNKPKDIASYYERHFNEDERLLRGCSRLEFEITQSPKGEKVTKIELA
jgi:hypothetical protein